MNFMTTYRIRTIEKPGHDGIRGLRMPSRVVCKDDESRERLERSPSFGLPAHFVAKRVLFGDVLFLKLADPLGPRAGYGLEFLGSGQSDTQLHAF